MSKMIDEEDETENEGRAAGGKNKMERDKALAPSLRYQTEPEDGENINIPSDAMGESISVFSTGSNLTPKGEANYPGKFKPVIGRQNLLKDEAGFNREGGKAGVE